MKATDFFRNIYEPIGRLAFVNQAHFISLLFTAGGSSYFSVLPTKKYGAEAYQNKIFNGSKRISDDIKRTFPKPINEQGLIDFFVQYINETNLPVLLNTFNIKVETAPDNNLFAQALASQFSLFVTTDSDDVSAIVASTYHIKDNLSVVTEKSGDASVECDVVTSPNNNRTDNKSLEAVKQLEELEHEGRHSETLVQAEKLLKELETDGREEYAVARLKVLIARIWLMTHAELSNVLEYTKSALSSSALKDDKEEYLLLLKTRAFALLFKQEIPQVNGIIAEIESSSPDDHDMLAVRQLKGLVAVDTGDVPTAISLLQENAQFYNAKLAVCSDAEKVLRYKLGYAESLNNMGHAYHEKGDYVSACEKIGEAVRLLKPDDDSNDINCEYELAIFEIAYVDSLLHCGRYNDCLDELDKADLLIAKHDIKHLRFRSAELRGRALYMLDRFPESKKCFEKALKLSDTNGAIMHFHRLLASFIMHDGDFASMKKHLRAARKIAEENNDAVIMHGIDKQFSNLKKYQGQKNLEFPDKNTVIKMHELPTVDDVPFMKPIMEHIDNRAEYHFLMKNKFREMLIENRDADENTPNQPEIPQAVIDALIKKAQEALNAYEKAGRYNTIGHNYALNRDLINSKYWNKRSLDLATEISATVIQVYALFGLADVALNTDGWDKLADDYYITQAEKILETIVDWELYARCKAERGEIEARKGNFEEAQKNFEEALSIMEDHKITDNHLRYVLVSSLNLICERKNLKKPSERTFSELYGELYFLENWYPEYRRQLRRYWWFYRGGDVIKNLTISENSKGLFAFSDDPKEIEFMASALTSIINTSAFAGRSEFDIPENFDIHDLPVPANIPFPYSIFLVHETDKRYGYYENSDGSKGEKPYQRCAPDTDVTYDETRKPKPMPLSFHGIDYPDALYKIDPIMTEDEMGGIWWIHADFGGGQYVSSVLHCAVDIKAIPVVRYDDVVKDKCVEIKTTKRVFIPFIDDIDEAAEHAKQFAPILNKICSAEGNFDTATFEDFLSTVSKSSNGKKSNGV